MSIPQNRKDFKNYCLRKLGEPAIQVNVTPEQVEDRVNEALDLFYERHYQGVEEIFILKDICDGYETVQDNIVTAMSEIVTNSDVPVTYGTEGSSVVYDEDKDDIKRGYLTLANDIIAVTDVFRPKNALGLSSAEYQFYINEIATMINPTGIHNGMSYFYMFDSHMTLVNRFFNPSKTYNFNTLSKKLIISGGLKNSERQYGGVVIRALRSLNGDANPIDDTIDVHNIWKNRWFQNYTTALIKMQWGQNLSKYQSVQLLGGITMNGDQMKDEARGETEQLREELAQSYELPAMPFWG